MSKPSFLTQSFGRKSLSIVVVSVLLLITTAFDVAQSQENGATDREEAFRRIVQSYVQAGKVEYDKGYYEQALKTFVMAQGYQEYLTATGREELHAHLEKTKAAVAQRKLALEEFQAADKLIKQNQLIEARANLESLRKNEYLTKEEQAQIVTVLKQIELKATNDKASPQVTAAKPEKIKEEIPKTGEQEKRQNQKIAELYRSSMKYYRAGQLEKAREGFVQVAASGLIPPPMKKNVEGYVAEIDKRLPQKVNKEPVQKEMVTVIEPKVFNLEAAEPEVNEPELVEPEVVEPRSSAIAPRIASPVTGQGTYIEQINTKRNILRTYTGTVVKNAVTKANAYIEQGQFDKANKEVEAAEYTVNENQIHLGEALFKEYSGKLKALTEEIAVKQNEKALQDEEAKRKAAIEGQNRFREQMEVDRQKRIADLMENALAYQKQQQYEAALGQLVSLLALDPQNNEALILKDTLEDMVFFRKQLEVQKEIGQQRADILLKTDESGIPYAEELTYPKNWREIINKPTRQPDKPIGLDPADASVYERLEQIVDLSTLTSSTSFSEVIMQLESSVDPPLQIQPNWKDLLENGEVEQTTPAGMDPLTGIKLRKALEVLLAGVSSEFAEIEYVVDEGIILIATVDTLPQNMVTRVYDITDLVGEPANYGGMQGMMMGRMMGMMSGGGGGMMGGGMGGGTGGMGLPADATPGAYGYGTTSTSRSTGRTTTPAARIPTRTPTARTTRPPTRTTTPTRPTPTRTPSRRAPKVTLPLPSTTEQTILFHLRVDFSQADNAEDIKPAAEMFMVALIENLRNALSGAFDQYSAKLNKQLNLAGEEAIRAEQNLVRIQQQIISLSGSRDLSRLSILSDIRNVRQKLQSTIMKRASDETIYEATAKQIAEEQARRKKLVEDDPITREFKSMLDVHERRLEETKKLYESGRASAADLEGIKEKIIRARIDLAKRQEEVSNPRGLVLSSTTDELANLATNMALAQQEIRSFEKQLEDEEDLLEKADTYELLSLKTGIARQSLEETLLWRARLGRNNRSIQPPDVTVIGAE